MSNQPPNTIMIVDDHPLFRQGLRRLIEDGSDFVVVAEASSGYEAVRQADLHSPQIVLTDIQLPGVSGLQIARILKKQHPDAQIIMISMHQDDDHVFDAMRAGAAAFLSKDVDAATLLDTIQRVADGEQPINQTVLQRPNLVWTVLSELRSSDDGDLDKDAQPPLSTPLPLSVREIEVLDCIAQGLANREIAEALFISEQTVKNHITSVLKKLGVTDRVQAVLVAVREGWIELGQPRNHNVGGVRTEPLAAPDE